MEIEILKERVFSFIGVIFFGNPFHTHPPWSPKNEIGNTWIRYMKVYTKYKEFLDKIRAGDEIGFEIHIEPEDYKNAKKFHIFVGLEVRNFDFFPMEMYSKILPKTQYIFTTSGYQGEGIDEIFTEWIPNSEYEQSYPYIMQTYSPKRWKGEKNPNSLMDWYIPIKKSSD
ncbi:MAG: GyrI-like domain-containing protein [Promethearchaeota archaeon]